MSDSHVTFSGQVCGRGVPSFVKRWVLESYWGELVMRVVKT